MPFPTGRFMPYSRILQSALALVGATALLLGGCRPMDGLTGDRQKDGDGDFNTLAIGLAVPPPKFSDAVVAQGFNTPMSMAFDPEGRLYVVEKGGTVKIVGQEAPVLTASQLPGLNQNGERGLLAVAFDPNWSNPAERWMYVHWCHTENNRVSRFKVSPAAPFTAGAEERLYDLSPLTAAPQHQGGPLHFAADGTLFISTGDNGAGANAQNTGNQIGKLLRINRQYSGTPGVPSIPANNPFFNSFTGNNRAIFALGLRNPYTYAIQPGTGRIFINDVGQDGYEEINETYATAGGQNFGWPITEGPTTDPRYTSPYGGYVNGVGVNQGDCAIIGAAFYNPPGTAPFPGAFLGDYFFGDHCSGYIKSLDPATKAVSDFATGIAKLMDLRVGPDGALYYLSLDGGVNGSGLVGKIAYTGGEAPSISRHPASATVSVGGSVVFSVEANGGGLTFQWQRNGVDIPGQTGTSYTLTAAAGDHNAQFRVVVRNSFGTATSNAAVLTVTSNQPPVATIAAPAAGATYAGGQAFTYSGSGSDPEDGALPASALTWRVDFHHGTHSHPFIPSTSGAASGSFTIPTSGETDDDVWYRIFLTVRDAGGLTHTATRDILPRKATVTLATTPAGLTVHVDGQPKVTPYTFTGVVGIERILSAPSQSQNGTEYTFASWSNGGAQTQTLSFPAANTTYTAAFQAGGSALPRTGWVATASHSNGGEWPANALDGNAGSRWSAGAPMANGQWFQVDMGSAKTFDRIAVDANGSSDYPRGYQVFVSDDGANWGAPIATGTGTTSLVTIAFTARTGRYIRIVQTGSNAFWWSIHEFNVYGSGNPPPPPPPAWNAQDIGAVGTAGGSTVDGSTYTVRGAGADIYGGADGFHFYHRTLSGDGSLTARIASLANTHEWAKAGIMIRETTAEGSRHVYVGTTPANGLEFLRREAHGGPTIPVAAAGGAPRWLRATRAGNLLTVFYSADGVAWTQFGQVALALAADVRMGLAVTSHNPAVLNTAVFDNVTAVE